MADPIIKIQGKPQDVVNQLRTLQAIFGKGCTLSTVAQMARYSRLIQAEKKQFQGGKTNGKRI